MKKIYKLTENDLTNLIRRVINEQVFQFLKQVLGTAGDDIAKADAKIAAQLDSVFANLSLGAKNIIQKNGKSFIVSSRGTELSLETFQALMKDVQSGRRSIDQIADYLPRQLVDGTEFRSIIVSNMKKLENVKSQNSPKGLVKLSSRGQTFYDNFKNSGNWLQVLNIKGNMSGWKFHIFTSNFDDTALVFDKVYDVVNRYGAGLKVGTGQMFNRSIGNPGSVQYDKGVTIYIPANVIKNGQQKQMLNDIQSAISEYKGGGNISGDKMITNNIGYRYELSKPIDPKLGVTKDDYYSLYSPNSEGSSFNIQNNLDIFK